MAITDIASRAKPFARDMANDDDLRDHLVRAGRAARGAVKARRQPVKRSGLRRAGEAIRESGQAIMAVGSVAEKRRRQQRRTRLLRAAAVGGAGTAVAVGARRRSAAVAARQEPETYPASTAAPGPSTPAQEETLNG